MPRRLHPVAQVRPGELLAESKLPLIADSMMIVLMIERHMLQNCANDFIQHAM
jgi:hypothetical protein